MAITWGAFALVLNYGLSAQVSLVVLFSLLMFARAATGVFMAMPQIPLQSYIMTTNNNEQQRWQSYG